MLSGNSQLVTVKSCDELTGMFDGIMTSWPTFWPSIRRIQELFVGDIDIAHIKPK